MIVSKAFGTAEALIFFDTEAACACCQAAATTIVPLRVVIVSRSRVVFRRRRHADADVKRVITAAEHDATQRADVAVVAAPGEREMALGWQDVVGGIEIHPAQRWTPDREPGVRRISPDEPRLSRRRLGQEIPA